MFACWACLWVVEPDVCGGVAEQRCDSEGGVLIGPDIAVQLFSGQAECFLEVGDAPAATPRVDLLSKQGRGKAM